MKQNVHRISLIILAIVLAVLCGFSKAQAGCYCMMRNKEISANYSKDGFQGCTTNVIGEWYLQSTEVDTDTGSGAEDYPDGTFYSFHVSRIKTSVTTYMLTNLPGVFISGEITSYGCPEYNLPWNETENMSDNGDTADENNFSYWSGGETTATDSSGDYTDSKSGTVAWYPGVDGGVETSAYTNQPSGFPYPGIDSLPVTYGNYYCIDGFSEDIHVHSSSDDYGSQNETYDTQTTYSQPFTDDMLRGCITSLMPSWPTNWSGGTGYAYYDLSPDHGCGSGGQMQYQVLVPNSQAVTVYILEWQEVTTYPGTTNESSTTMDENVLGTGDPVNPAPGAVHFVPMPTKQCSIYETAPTIIRVIPGGGGSGGGGSPGSGGPGSLAGGTGS